MKKYINIQKHIILKKNGYIELGTFKIMIKIFITENENENKKKNKKILKSRGEKSSL
jgi:riboflavin synthase